MKKVKQILKSSLLYLPLVLLTYVLIVKFDIIKLNRNQPFELFSDMDRQPKIHPQKESRFFENGATTRMPVDSTFPVCGSSYRWEQVEYFIPESTLTNPLPDDDFYINRGKDRFETFCVPCHNHDGKGKGLIVTKVKLKADEEGFPEPANLTRPESKRLTDGRLFHILSSGQNLMFPVIEKLSVDERWAVIKYIRILQKMN